MPQFLITVRFTRDPDAPAHLYLLEGELAPDDLQRLTSELLHDPVVQVATWCALSDLAEENSSSRVEVAFKPGVTDNEAESIKIGAARLGIGGLRTVKTLRRYLLGGADVRDSALAGLYNPLIQTMLHTHADAAASLRKAAVGFTEEDGGRMLAVDPKAAHGVRLTLVEQSRR